MKKQEAGSTLYSDKPSNRDPMKKYYLGIDLGINGAFAEISPSGVITEPMPLIYSSNEIDYRSIYNILKEYKDFDVHVVFEKLGIIFGSSKKTSFSMGGQLRAVEMACIALDLPYTMVRAKDWQKELFQGVSEIKKGESRDTKSMALVAVKRLFPHIKLTFGERAVKPHDGLVDAILLAEYARRHF